MRILRDISALQNIEKETLIQTMWESQIDTQGCPHTAILYGTCMPKLMEFLLMFCDLFFAKFIINIDSLNCTFNS